MAVTRLIDKPSSVNNKTTSTDKPSLPSSERKSPKKLERGGRNLVLLGVISFVIAFATVTVSLLIYHNSGDIYLDRSRPGFLPDEDGIEDDDTDDDYVFEKSGPVTMEVLEEYLRHLDTEVQSIDDYTDPFGPDALSDSTLGI